jgi:hypothetical protein
LLAPSRPCCSHFQRLHNGGRFLGSKLRLDAHHVGFGLTRPDEATGYLVVGRRRPPVFEPTHGAPEAATDPLELGRGRRARHLEQGRFVVKRCDSGQSACLGVAHAAVAERVVDQRQLTQGTGDANVLARRAQIEANAPREPVGAR